MDNDWIDTTKWILEDTCPDCGKLQCQPGIDRINKIIAYICFNPKCDTLIFNARCDSEWHNVDVAQV